MKKLLYHLKRIVVYLFLAHSNRNLVTFRERSSASKTLISLYLKSIGRNKGNQVTTKFFDFKITGLNAASLLYLFNEIFLKKEYAFSCESGQPRIIDCGANIGSAVLFFKKLYPQAEIIAIEPNPIIFKLLEKNVIDNNLKGVRLLNCCLSNIEGLQDFFFETEGTDNLSGSIYETRGNKFQVRVESKKLSSIIRDESFDLIKIDVEGAEREIFQDLVESGKIESCSNYYMEYHHHPNMEDKFTEMVSVFSKNGFAYKIRADFNIRLSFQDIVMFFYRH